MQGCSIRTVAGPANGLLAAGLPYGITERCGNAHSGSLPVGWIHQSAEDICSLTYFDALQIWKDWDRFFKGEGPAILIGMDVPF